MVNLYLFNYMNNKNLFKILLVIVFILILAIITSKACNASRIRCVDGDTFAIGKKYYRLAYIDTPEKNQYNYKKASRFTCDWLTNNSTIIEEIGLDKYGRTLAVVWKLQRSYTMDNMGENLNELLIKNQLAKPFYGKTTKNIINLYDTYNK